MPSGLVGPKRLAKRAEACEPATEGDAGDKGEEGGARDADGGAGFAELRFGLQHVLVGDVDLLFEGIERGVVEDLPPLAAEHSVAGLRFLPAGGRRLP